MVPTDGKLNKYSALKYPRYFLRSYSESPALGLDFGHFICKGGPSYSDEESNVGKSFNNAARFSNKIVSFPGHCSFT